MKSSSAHTAAKTALCWLRWAVVSALVGFASANLLYIALGAEGRDFWRVPLVVFGNLVYMFLFALKEMAFVVVGAKIAPRARFTTAIVLAAIHVPLAFWNQVLSRVSFDELVLLEGRANYMPFALETLGAALGVAYIFWSQKADGLVGDKAAPTTAKMLIRWLRWAVVLGLVYSAIGTLVYSAMGPQVVPPAPLAVVQNAVSLLFSVPRETGFVVVVAGALIAPRFRRTTALVLAALHISLSFWGHVLAAGGPWSSWTINYTHFTLETLSTVLGVVYIFWSERAERSVASVVPDSPP